MKLNVNETWINWAGLVAAVGLVWFLISGGQIGASSVIGQFSGMFAQLVFYTCAVFGFQKFLLGFGRDIMSEIFDQNNIAAAIYMGALMLGMASVIAKAML